MKHLSQTKNKGDRIDCECGSYCYSNNVFYSNVERKSALMTAACNGCKDIAELLIANGASVRIVDDKGHTPLHLASIKGHKDVVELLIANGAQIDARSEDSCTPL